MHRLFATLIACAVLSAGCTETVTLKEGLKQGQATPKPSATLGSPRELAQGIWSVAVEVDVPTTGISFIRPGDDPSIGTASLLLSSYQDAFASELQRVLDALLRRNAHCTISALSVMHARETWLGDAHGGPMALPSGAIVILPCGGNEPLVKPELPKQEAPAPTAPH